MARPADRRDPGPDRRGVRALIRAPVRVAATLLVAAISLACSSEKEPSGDAPMAGVSENLDAPVEPHEPSEFGADTATVAYDRFRHRCAGCHPAPSPAMHDASGWEAVFSRMEGHVEEAGLIRLERSEGEAILDLLREHATEPAE